MFRNTSKSTVNVLWSKLQSWDENSSVDSKGELYPLSVAVSSSSGLAHGQSEQLATRNRLATHFGTRLEDLEFADDKWIRYNICACFLIIGNTFQNCARFLSFLDNVRYQLSFKGMNKLLIQFKCISTCLQWSNVSIIFYLSWFTTPSEILICM